MDDSRIALAIVPLIRRSMLTDAGARCLDSLDDEAIRVPVGVPTGVFKRVPLGLQAKNADKSTGIGVPL